MNSLDLIGELKAEIIRTGLSLPQASKISGIPQRSIYRYWHEEHRCYFSGSRIIVKRGLKRLRRLPSRKERR